MNIISVTLDSKSLVYKYRKIKGLMMYQVTELPNKMKNRRIKTLSEEDV